MNTHVVRCRAKLINYAEENDLILFWELLATNVKYVSEYRIILC